jgi:hypothetical protein
MRIRTGVLFTALVVPLLSGCSTLRATMDGWGQGRDGLSRPQRELRTALADGNFPVALAMREDDALLRALTTGVTAYYASQFERSAALMDSAVLLTDERLTASVSKNALSLVTNDMARPYVPRRTERLFVPYYGMLAYARLGQWEEAAVEARRMVALLAQAGAERDDAERALHASMSYLAGAVFERAGERDASLVAYRNAHALQPSYPELTFAHGADDGDVLVVVERGFVAHRASETIHVVLGDDDRDGLRGDDDSRRAAIDRLGRRLTPAPAGSAFVQKDVPPASVERVGLGALRHIGGGDDDDDDDLRHLSLAFPALRRSPRPWAGAPRLLVDSAADSVVTAAEVSVGASVDDASGVDERRERAGTISRELARAAAKYAVTKAVREKKGEIAGSIAELGANLLERADVRSWHLLPQEVVLLRVRLPAGQHHLRVAVGDGANYRVADLGPVTVVRGSVTVAPARLWKEPAPERSVRCRRHSTSCGDRDR